VSRAFFVWMLMTPLTALAPQSVALGPRTTSMRSRSASSVSCASPKHAREKRRVEATAVHHHEKFIGGGEVEAARSDGPRATIGASDAEASRPAERVGERSRSGAANVITGEDRDRGSGGGKNFGTSGSGGDIHGHQLFERETFQVRRRGELDRCGVGAWPLPRATHRRWMRVEAMLRFEALFNRVRGGEDGRWRCGIGEVKTVSR